MNEKRREKERERVMKKHNDLDKLVDENLDALDASVVAAVDLGCLARGLLDEQAYEIVGPVAQLDRALLALAGVVVGRLGRLVVGHLLDHRLAPREQASSCSPVRLLSQLSRRCRLGRSLGISRSQILTCHLLAPILVLLIFALLGSSSMHLSLTLSRTCTLITTLGNFPNRRLLLRCFTHCSSSPLHLAQRSYARGLRATHSECTLPARTIARSGEGACSAFVWTERRARTFAACVRG